MCCLQHGNSQGLHSIMSLRRNVMGLPRPELQTHTHAHTKCQHSVVSSLKQGPVSEKGCNQCEESKFGASQLYIILSAGRFPLGFYLLQVC